MKLDTVILASNDNPDYLNFWPIVSEAWKLMGVDPLLIYTGDTEQKLSGNVIKFNSLNLDSSYVAQNIRILYPGLLKNKNCIVSDIDLLPLSKNYFLNSIRRIPDNSFIIYRPNAGVPSNMISMMWNAANSSTWSEIFNVNNEASVYKKLKKWNKRNYSIQGKGWYTDQIQLRKHVNKFSKNNASRIVMLDDNINGFRRFNRTKLDEHMRLLESQDIIFSDFHMPRPYEKYEKIINEVFQKQKKYLVEG